MVTRAAQIEDLLYDRWSELIKKASLKGTIIDHQQQRYQQGTLPKIASEEIKLIPLLEDSEPCIDLRTLHHQRLKMIADDPQGKIFQSPDCNVGFAHSGKVRNSVFLALQSFLEALDLNAKAFGFEFGKIGIHVFEGLRALDSQAFLFNNKAQEIKQANPHWSEEQVQEKTYKWVSPVKNNVPVHSTGAAVELRLSDGKSFMDMGKFGVIWGLILQHQPFQKTLPPFKDAIAFTFLNQRKTPVLSIILMNGGISH